MISNSFERPDRTVRRVNETRRRYKMRSTPLRIGRCTSGHPYPSELLVQDHLLEMGQTAATVLSRPGRRQETAIGEQR